MEELERFVREHEGALRLGAFAGLLTVFALAEAAAPRRARTESLARRWGTNGGMALAGAVLGRLLAPLGAVAAAQLAAERGWGVLRALDLGPALAFTVAVVLLDLAVWAQHVATHHVPLLWRLHRVHHLDLDLDATSGVRFHPVEIGVSLVWKAAVVLALGATPAAVVVFEVLLNGTALFNHANLRLPPSVDRALRTVLVTPDMHRVHHSIAPEETNSNYGFALSLWDRLFRTYRAQPIEGHVGMSLGLAELRDPRRAEGLGWLLASPVRRALDGDDARVVKQESDRASRPPGRSRP